MGERSLGRHLRFPSEGDDFRRAIVLRILVAFSLIFLTGCSGGYVTDKPDKSDIVGDWIPDEATLRDMRERGGYRNVGLTKLTFREDGTFDLMNMPDWWRNGFGEPHGGFENASGTWELVNYGGHWEIGLYLPYLYTNVGLIKGRSGQSKVYGIEVILGDPDSRNEMIFVRNSYLSPK